MTQGVSATSTKENLLNKYYQSPLGQRKAKYLQLLKKFQNENGLLEGELFSRSRKDKLVRLRREFFFIMKNECGYSFSEIARIFKMDHTTVLHNYRAYEEENGIERQPFK